MLFCTVGYLLSLREDFVQHFLNLVVNFFRDVNSIFLEGLGHISKTVAPYNQELFRECCHSNVFSHSLIFVIVLIGSHSN